MDPTFVKESFTEDAEAWILDGYNYDGYNYPVALDRLKLVLEQIRLLNRPSLKIVDLGCGGGNIAIELGRLGHFVDAIDSSETMIEIAEKKLSEEDKSTQENVKFICSDIEINNLSSNKYDVIISMGVIGYLDSDNTLFIEAKKLLKPGGVLFISCRNQLFNMVSLSGRTFNEINQSNATKLLEELDELDTSIPPDIANQLVEKLNAITNNLLDSDNVTQNINKSPSQKNNIEYSIVDTIEARQHTPKNLDKTATKFRFECLGHLGVHPHLLNPKINNALPPSLYNKLSDCLNPLAALPISLSWSSCFIGMYKLKQDISR